MYERKPAKTFKISKKIIFTFLKKSGIITKNSYMSAKKQNGISKSERKQ